MQAQQLALFLPSAHRALVTATSLRLQLPLPGHDGTQTDDPYGLSPLAKACPAVRHLGVEGSPSPALLQLFGRTVTKFDFLAPQLPPTTVERLAELLPHIRELIIGAYTHGGLQQLPEVASPYNLTALASVEHLNVPKLHICSNAMWASFPPNLTQLTCAGVHMPPLASFTAERLEVLHLSASTCTAGSLAGLFRACPSLHCVSSSKPTIDVDSGLEAMDDVDPLLIEALGADLTLLNARHASGVTSCPYSVIFYDCEFLSACLAGLPVLAGFTEVVLDWVSVITTTEVLSLLFSVFSDASSLEMSNSETLDDLMLLALLQLKGLRSLTLRRCPGVTAQGLTFLVSHLPHVRELNCLECESVTEEQMDVLQAMMLMVDRVIVLEFEAVVVDPVSSGSGSESE